MEGVIYLLTYVGGPMDGQEVWSPRPYDAFCEEENHIYRADDEGEACLEWVDDETRRITLRYLGKDVEWPPRRPYHV